MKQQEDRNERQERTWRAKRALLDKSLDEGAGHREVYVSRVSLAVWMSVGWLVGLIDLV